MRLRLSVLACLLLCAVALTQVPVMPGRAAADALHHRTLSNLRHFTNWLAKYHVRGFIGEVGWPDDFRSAGEAAQWNNLAESWYQAADAAKLWVGVWAT